MLRDNFGERLTCGLLMFAAFAPAPALAQTTPSASPQVRNDHWEPLFIGYGSEPGMDYGGRTLASLDSTASRAIGGINHVWDKHPAAAPLWELPMAIFPLLIQHEEIGHGGRAREFGLNPSYGLIHTSLRYPPHTNEERALFYAGGVEAESVMVRRILFGLLAPEGSDGAKVPLALFAKFDLTYYVEKTGRPNNQHFVDQYRSGNDIAGYLVSRQAQRKGIDLSVAGQTPYTPDLNDPMLENNWRLARAAALWNLLDPSLVAGTVGYVRDHVLDGHVRVQAPVWKVTDRVGLTLGTRAALDPQEISRFLDLYAKTPWGVATAYVRRLDSSMDGTWGFGAAMNTLRIARGATVGVAADLWKEPMALEHLPGGSEWNIGSEVDAHLAGHWGFAAKLGIKSRGSLPGLPLNQGLYVGFGGTVFW